MPTSRSSQQAQSGFTLLELVVVMVLLGLISSLTLPAMQRWHAGLIARSEASAVVEALQAAAFDAGVQRRSLRLDAGSFAVTAPNSKATGTTVDAADRKFALAQIPLPAGWQVGRTVPAVFGADGLCKPGLVALRSASGTPLIFQVQGPVCRVDWQLDLSATAQPAG